MKLVVVGAAGPLAEELVQALRTQGHEVVRFEVATGPAVAGALFSNAGAALDLANLPPLDRGAPRAAPAPLTPAAVAAAAAAGIGHYVALFAAGLPRQVDHGYAGARAAQEALIRTAGLPYSLLHSGPLFDWLEAIVRACSEEDAVHVAPAAAQPVASEDLLQVLIDVALGPPLNGVLEVVGPEVIYFDELARLVLSARETPRRILADLRNGGPAELEPPPLRARRGATRVSEWLRHSIPPG